MSNDLTPTNPDMANVMAAMNNAVQSMASSIATMTTMLKKQQNQIDTIQKQTDKNTGAIDTLANKAAIEYEDTKALKGAACLRICELLGVPSVKRDRTIEDHTTWEKYHSIFYSRLYYEVSKKGHLRVPVAKTTKENYGDALREINVWNPSNGASGLKQEADNLAKARKIAREQGYE